MRSETFNIDDIVIGPRHRKLLDPAKVADLAASIDDVGLMNPPAVRMKDGAAVLIVGHHRLLALEEIGRTHVECHVYDVDDDRAELMEVDENLARANLSPAEEAAHVARRRHLHERIHGPAKAIGGRASAAAQGRSVVASAESAFATGTAKEIGKSVRSVQIAAQRGAVLGDNLSRIAGTSLDKGVELDALVKMAAPERAAIIERAAAGEVVTALAPRPSRVVTRLTNDDDMAALTEWLEEISTQGLRGRKAWLEDGLDVLEKALPPGMHPLVKSMARATLTAAINRR